jgi:exosortase family protein XrtF
MWREFKPALRFVFLFLSIYLVGNTFYSLFIGTYHPSPDPFIRLVAKHTSFFLNEINQSVTLTDNPRLPTIFLMNQNVIMLDIYEGCNGVNVAIVFVAFIAAFGGSWRKMLWFLPLGTLIIHLANIARIVLLYFVYLGDRRYFYFLHKYVFTAAIYFIVVVLWFCWVNIIKRKSVTAKALV